MVQRRVLGTQCPVASEIRFANEARTGALSALALRLPCLSLPFAVQCPVGGVRSGAMRIFGFLGTIVTLAVGMYIYSLQVKAIDPSAAATGAANSTEAPLIAGVKNDLIAIASAERGYLASEGRYGSLDELISGNYITIKAERPPYTYDVQTSANNFRVTATRSTQGSPSELWITDDMQVQASK